MKFYSIEDFWTWYINFEDKEDIIDIKIITNRKNQHCPVVSFGENPHVKLFVNNNKCVELEIKSNKGLLVLYNTHGLDKVLCDQQDKQWINCWKALERHPLPSDSIVSFEVKIYSRWFDCF